MSVTVTMAGFLLAVVICWHERDQGIAQRAFSHVVGGWHARIRGGWHARIGAREDWAWESQWVLLVGGTRGLASVKERIEDRASAAEVSTADAQDHRIEHGEKAGWLAPIPLEAKRKKVREKETDRRAGNKGCRPMSLDDYLKLLDWTGRQFRSDKRGVIPAACAPILDRLDCSEESWFDLVKNFRKRFRNEAGSLLSVRAFRSKRRERRAQTATA